MTGFNLTGAVGRAGQLKDRTNRKQRLLRRSLSYIKLAWLMLLIAVPTQLASQTSAARCGHTPSDGVTSVQREDGRTEHFVPVPSFQCRHLTSNGNGGDSWTSQKCDHRNAPIEPEPRSSGVEMKDFSILPYTGTKPKTIDHQFVLFNTLQIAASVADAETTVAGIRLGLNEVNPFVGRHPTRARVYEVVLPVDSVIVLLSYHYKRISPSRKWWRLYPESGIAVHTFAAASNGIEIASH